MSAARLLAIGLTCLALVSCSSDPDPDPSGETTTSSASADETTTSEATSSTTSSEEEAVAAAFRAGSADFRECVAAPTDCDESILGNSFTGELLDVLDQRVKDLREEGLVVLPPSDPAHLEIDERGVSFSADGVEAELAVCTIDAGVTVQPGAGEDGADLIVDDSIVASSAIVFARFESSDGWRFYQIEVQERYEGPDGCSL